MQVAPSILSADFGNLANEIKDICQNDADLVHVDVMDGYFVPNMTIGDVVVQAVDRASNKPLDIHLMVEDNKFFIDMFAKYHPKYISFHIESEKHPHRLIEYIRLLDISPAIALNPHTPISVLEHIIDNLDMVLLMSVNPGFGGQSFLPLVLEKAKELKKLIKLKNPTCKIEVDGGVNDKNINLLKDAGVDIVVAGSYVFKSSDTKRAIKSLK